MPLEEKAYAKINLHLEVLNKRNDGFHNIFSLMAQVDLFDILKLESAGIDSTGASAVSVGILNAGGRCSEIIRGIPAEENLITKAAVTFCKEAGISGNFVFSLEKNIPSGAGLAGGSSDAAAALRILNAKTGLPKERLMKTASAVGADVPFLIDGGYAICEGKGDIIEKLTGRLGYTIVLANNSIHVDTGKAYRLLERSNDFVKTGAKNETVKEVIRKFVRAGKIDNAQDLLVNDFEPVVFKQHPVLADIKKRMLDMGADFALMSGSGSTIIGLFGDRERAAEASAGLRRDIEYVVTAAFCG
ncbi:MAG: 4-(cytidine 5'-diphospho)-2-C-methyl-D-erythritol kinase [Spirochaetia bacterium]|jgi:4-diphosphocytidyl-2-C-methyl-D-erythritol kinase|nr:4-(cytidine 5'-diphospho)-2-C-methyl-D-erythritol kinase [Spirochaetia bacterium]